MGPALSWRASGAPANALKSSTAMIRRGARARNTVSSIVRISAALTAGIDRFTAGPPHADPIMSFRVLSMIDEPISAVS